MSSTAHRLLPRELRPPQSQSSDRTTAEMRESTASVHESTDCQKVRYVLDRVGHRWSVLVIAQLENGPLRFADLKRLMFGVSQQMLTRTLRGLERDGLVDRTVTPTAPPRVDYELTALGQSLAAPIAALRSWAVSHGETIEGARASFDMKAS